MDRIKWNKEAKSFSEESKFYGRAQDFKDKCKYLVLFRNNVNIDGTEIKGYRYTIMNKDDLSRLSDSPAGGKIEHTFLITE